jgi:hypothetical protein
MLDLTAMHPLPAPPLCMVLRQKIVELLLLLVRLIEPAIDTFMVDVFNLLYVPHSLKPQRDEFRGEPFIESL